MPADAQAMMARAAGAGKRWLRATPPGSVAAPLPPPVPRPTWLYLAGVDAEGRVIRYYPRPPERQSLTLTPASSEQPLPGSIRLSIRHHPGVVKVVGLVTQSPLDPNDGDARVLRAVSSGEVPEGGGVLQLNLVVLP